MITIRKNVFETNSSSAHSFVYNGFDPAVDDYLKMEGREYGWEWVKYETAEDRLCYMFTAAIDVFPLKELIEHAKNIVEYFKKEGVEVDIEWLNDLYIKTHYSNGNEIDKPYIKHRLYDFVGIDHQSAPGEDGECKKLAESFADPVKVWNFVMDDGNEIWTGNDNEDPPYNW